MLRQLLHDFALPQRLMGRAEGERVLTNVLHLAELLQQASAELDGELALIRHLSELLANEGQAADDQVLRLESDEALVRVVTIHKSKGLEYPLVFLPFICAFRSVDSDKPIRIHDGEQRRLVFNADAQTLARAERERLGEDLRLLYVALTRARHACWMGVADLKIGNAHRSRLHDSALGYLLGGGLPLAASQDLNRWLAPLIDPLRSAVAAAPEASQQHFRADEAQLPPVQWSTPERDAAEHWWIASYSALRLDERAIIPVSRHEDSAPDSLAMQNSTDDDSSEVVPASLLMSAQGLHRFPRGSNPGTFLHGLLELAAEEGFAHCLANQAQLREVVARRCQRRGLEAWIDPLHEWLLALLSQQMALGDGGSVSLGDLTQYQAELEFWFEARQVDVRQLDQLVRSTELPGLPRQPLQADTLNGMFKGFIDLAFEYQGRYYVADYKSNWLGADDTAYTREAMESSMAAHRYDLQYVLYVLALHRQLRLRLPDYDYDRHMGGAVYLFMRAPGNGVYQVRPAKVLIEQLDALFLGQSQESFA